MTGSIRLDHPYHLELPSLRRVGRHFQLDGGAGNSPSSRFDYVLDLSSLEEVGGHFDIMGTSLDDFTQVTSLKRVGGWLHIWSNNNPLKSCRPSPMVSSPLKQFTFVHEAEMGVVKIVQVTLPIRGVPRAGKGPLTDLETLLWMSS